MHLVAVVSYGLPHHGGPRSEYPDSGGGRVGAPGWTSLSLFVTCSHRDVLRQYVARVATCLLKTVSAIAAVFARRRDGETHIRLAGSQAVAVVGLSPGPDVVREYS